MARRPRTRRKARQQSRQTNWYVIGGIVVVSIVALFGLLYLTTLGDNENSLLVNYCASNPGNCISKGNAEADVTVVEVSAYGCGACANFNQRLAGPLDELYVESNKVNWIAMPFALRDQSGQYPTLPTAVSAMCANEQGRFFDYHVAVFGLQQGPLFNTEEGFIQTASSLDMDVTEFTSCLADNDYADIVLRNIDMAQRAGLRVTPTFFINDRMVSGLPSSFADFQQMIDRELD